MIVTMHQVNLHGIDLNLLTALRALLEARNVTRAAERAGLSQPAMSRALGRLRALLDDPLLVRGPEGLVPTPRAQALHEPLLRALAEIEGLIQAPRFDPATATGRFTVMTTDYTAVTLMPAVLTRLRREAPGIDLSLRGMGVEAVELAAANAVDIIITALGAEAPSGFYTQRLYEDGYVCLLRAGHPAAAEPLTLDRFVALDHALISTTGRGLGPVDSALERIGRRRRVALRIQHFLAAPWLIAASDLILTLPRRLGQWAAPQAGLALLEPPLDVGTTALAQAWHARRHHDPAHAWLRGLMAQAARQMA